MKPGVLVVAKKGAEAALEAGRQLAEWLAARGHAVVDVTKTEGPIEAAAVKGVALGVAIGGDGTFLRLVRRLERKEAFPILGVNLGTLGFITDFSPDRMLPAVEKALRGGCAEERRPLMEVELWRGGACVERAVFFNDAAISKDPRTPILRFDVLAGGKLLSKVSADGYIISTPTGSTAYNLSAGGPLVHPEVEAMTLVAMCCHSLSARPLVLPRSMPLEIHAREFHGLAFLVVDGQVSYEIRMGDSIRVQGAKSSLRLVRAEGQGWSEALRTKLDFD